MKRQERLEGKLRAELQNDYAEDAISIANAMLLYLFTTKVLVKHHLCAGCQPHSTEQK